MIYKYTKCESVIAKIMADADMSEKNIRVTDIREWIFEAVEKIGSPVQYVQKESGEDGVPIFEIHEHQVPLPEDLESLTAVAYSNNGTNWVQARKDESSFKFNTNTKAMHHYHPIQPAGTSLITHRSQLLGINGSTALLDAIRDKRMVVHHIGLNQDGLYLIKKTALLSCLTKLLLQTREVILLSQTQHRIRRLYTGM